MAAENSFASSVPQKKDHGSSLMFGLIIGSSVLVFGYAAIQILVMTGIIEDPIAKLFQEELSSRSNIGASMFDEQGGQKNFSGEISAEVQNCMQTGEVVEIASDAKMTEKEKKSYLDSVLGHAIKNGEVEWEWDGDKSNYVVYATKGDEKFWECFFAVEKPFFETQMQVKHVEVSTK